MYCVCVKEAEALVAAVFPENKAAATPEIAVYLKEVAGNSTRIDYGTGNNDTHTRVSYFLESTNFPSRDNCNKLLGVPVFPFKPEVHV